MRTALRVLAGILGVVIAVPLGLLSVAGVQYLRNDNPIGLPPRTGLTRSAGYPWIGRTLHATAS